VIASIGLWLTRVNGEPLVDQATYFVAFSMFGAVGALIVARDGRNVIGLLLIWTSMAVAIGFACSEITTWLIRRGFDGSVVVAAAMADYMGWVLGILPATFLLPLLFPNGRPPSPRWRPVLWLILLFLVLLFLGITLGSPTFTGSSDSESVANPFYVSALAGLPFDPVIAAFYVGLFITSVVSLLVRFKGATGVARQQIKWVAFGTLAALVAILLSDFAGLGGAASDLLAGLGFLVFPVTIGIAVLRFHLYDLDVVVRKTVVYAALALFATLVYVALVVGLGAWMGRGSSFLTMVAAVVVAVTFQPVRGVLTRFANRLVYGRRATPYEVLSEFSERVGGAYADEDVLPRMARVLGEGVGAERADVWLALDRELRDVAAWPPGSSRFDPLALGDGSVPPIAGAERVYPVEHTGELLGALAITKPASDPVSPADEKLIRDLAAQAGLVLRNVRLTEELRARLDDLKAVQRRLVTAQDEERRRLERNIHDGAQQQLVALAVKQRLVRQLVARDPEKAVELLAQVQGETNEALEDLRNLARGIYPPLLADQGLAPALEAQGRRSPVPITIAAAGVGRYAQEVEAAVYFSCLEALQNVAKYAEATRAEVRLAEANGDLTFEVWDDGRGFDPTATASGTGLQGIADRLSVLDGELAIRSEPGSGTHVRGRIPARPVIAP
jgi:signal transduction histidine kinase